MLGSLDAALSLEGEGNELLRSGRAALFEAQNSLANNTLVLVPMLFGHPVKSGLAIDV